MNEFKWNSARAPAFSTERTLRLTEINKERKIKTTRTNTDAEQLERFIRGATADGTIESGRFEWKSDSIKHVGNVWWF